MHLLYFHGSTLQAFWSTGKIRFLDALNPERMFSSIHMVNLDPGSAENVERSEREFRFTSIGLRKKGNHLVAKVAALRQATRELARESPTLVLADDANLLGLAARRVARQARSPYAVCVYYDNDLHFSLTGRPALAFLRSRRLESALEHVVFRGAAGVYAASRGYRDYALRHGASSDRTYLGSWSVDEIFYAPPVSPHPDGRELLFVGRLHPLKYLDDILHAMRDLPASLRLDVAGEGTERTRLEALATSLGVASRVRFLGVVPREDLLARMQAARVLLVTQGLSAAVECVMSGRPVVAYDHECNGEVVQDGETGLLVPFRNTPGLVSAVLRIVGDAQLAKRLGATGRERMLEACDIPRSIGHRRTFFERCLQG